MTAMTGILPKDDNKVSDIMARLSELLDVEWRILSQAQYDLLPDITAEKQLLEGQLQVELASQRKIADGNPHAGLIINVEIVSQVREKIARNNVRLKAKRDACLKRIRAGWAATAGDGATSYGKDGDLRARAKQKVFSVKM